MIPGTMSLRKLVEVDSTMPTILNLMVHNKGNVIWMI